MRFSEWHKYLIPFLVVPAALGMVLLIPPLKEKTSLLPFLAAVVISAWRGGIIPSLIAAFLSAIVWSLYVVEPASRFDLTTDDLTRLCLFVLLAVLVSTLYSARQRAQLAAEASERRLNVALDAAKLAIWEYDVADGRFWTSASLDTLWSGNAKPVLTFAQFQGRIHAEDRTRFVETATRAIELGESFELTHRLEGMTRPVRTVGRIQWAPSGRVAKVIGVVIATGSADI